MVFAVGALVSGGAGLALAAGSPAADTVPTTTEPAPTPTTTPAPDPAPDPAPTPPKPKPVQHVSKPVTHVSHPAPTPAPKPTYRPPVQTPAPVVQTPVSTPAPTTRVYVAPKVTAKPKVHRHVAKPKPKPAKVIEKPKVTRHAAAPLPVVAVEQGISSAPAARTSPPWRRMLLWTLLAASIAAFGFAVLPTVVPRGSLVVEARFPLALFGTLLLAASVGFWLVGVR